MYFDSFNLLAYKFGTSHKLVANIFNRIAITDEVKDSIAHMEEYVIKDGDTPRNLAFRLYNDANYDWIIRLLNDIVDEYDEWPMQQNTLMEYCKKKYGIADLSSVHHYESMEGEIVDSQHPSYDRKIITNFEYEEALNNEKRKIKLLKPSILPKFLAQFEELINE